MADDPVSNARASGSNASQPSEARNRQLSNSFKITSASNALLNAPIPRSIIDAAVIHITIAIRAAKMGAEDAWAIAIQALKKLDLRTIAKAAMEWMKAHPWETAALLVPLVLVACTPAFLGLAGFTAGGVAAGSIAAGIQAGIGNVVAGSVFATLTSAGMAGYGLPIVLGGVGGISSAVGWGIAAWKRWRNDSDQADGDGDGDGRGDKHAGDEGAETTQSVPRLLGG
ncbi:hypothetical protein P171DRAFT_428344 [Karstenula rhodostoma CBS 690.94]|uniref:Uncharacterized protein n=1 Tax=Karstenula rhodostoma CBS 690.94 TaxID=1392251 RepID=A0A9P4UFM9_9PLEO|nr:hypothetical protein P171DRAFT_428344 [Karstenula rhodostoma CBS 690.94]